MHIFEYKSDGCRIIQMPVLQDNYQYLLICSKTSEAAVIDAPDAAVVVKAAQKYGAKLTAIWNTHHHWDHTGANAELAQRFGLPVYCGAYDHANARVEAARHALSEGDTVRVGALEFVVLEIPGHTLGHIAFHGHGVVFAGDTLFAGGCGRLFEGTAAQMHASLGKLAALPDATRVFCMHEYTRRNLEFALTLEPHNAALRAKYADVCSARDRDLPTVPTTIGEEKSYNPFLRCGSGKLRQALAKPPDVDPVCLFAEIRRMKDAF